MLEIKNTEVFGLERAIKASGNAMTIGEINTQNFYTKEMTKYGVVEDTDFSKDRIRAEKLGSTNVGSGHDHYLLGVHVQFDIKYPQYWTPEAQRYHNFEIITSQSKMHRLTTMGKDDSFASMFNKYVNKDIIEYVQSVISLYNSYTDYEKQEDGTYINGVQYCEPRSLDELLQEKYETFMKIISNLPMGFEMWMTCDLTYLQLKTMYLQRRNHKLKEDWGNFCEWCESLPMFKELIGIKETING